MAVISLAMKMPVGKPRTISAALVAIAAVVAIITAALALDGGSGTIGIDHPAAISRAIVSATFVGPGGTEYLPPRGDAWLGEIRYEDAMALLDENVSPAREQFRGETVFMYIFDLTEGA